MQNNTKDIEKYAILYMQLCVKVLKLWIYSMYIYLLYISFIYPYLIIINMFFLL